MMPTHVLTTIKHYPTVTFFILAFALTWANWVPRALVSRGLLSFQVPDWIAIVAGYGPALAAIIVTTLVYGLTGLRQLLRRLAQWRVGLRWYAFALLVPPLIGAAGIMLHLITGGMAPYFASSGSGPFGPNAGPLWQQFAMLLLILTLGFDGLGEELGWRGFGLPHLQKTHSAFAATLILGVCWGVWHIPYALSEGSFLSNRPIFWFLVDILASAILFTWLFNNTGGSVLLAILYHASGNTTATILPTVWMRLGLAQSDPVSVPPQNDLRIFLFQMTVRWLIAIVLLLVVGRELGRQSAACEPLSVAPAR